MAAERRVAALSRHLTNAVDVDIVSKTSLRDFDADEVYRFLTRDNLELRAEMLDHLKVRERPHAAYTCGNEYTIFRLMASARSGHFLSLFAKMSLY